MRRAMLLWVATAVLAATPAPSAGGWRSADRPGMDDAVDDAGERGVADPQWRQEGRGRQRQQAERVQGTRPYWGTMRPYWNAPEEPGVIHRGARSAPLKVR